jgi:hypothetical protein
MTLIIILILVILLFGGGWWGYQSYGPHVGGGWVGIILLVILVLWLTGNLHGVG